MIVEVYPAVSRLFQLLQGGSLRSAIAPASQGPPMMTRGRAHPLTVEEPTITMTVADTYWLIPRLPLL